MNRVDAVCMHCAVKENIGADYNANFVFKNMVLH